MPELDTDVGTGMEGDVEARCFSASAREIYISADGIRARLAKRPAGCDHVHPHRHLAPAVRRDPVQVRLESSLASCG